MIDVACFCGTSYSFDADLGTCPKCREVVGLAGAFPAAGQRMLDELDRLASQPRAEVAVASATQGRA
jgi:hypothetical protein